MYHYITRILIVDDDELVTRQLKTALELNGEFLVRAENVSTNAVRAAQEFSPDLMILDEVMPEITGGMLKEHFREDVRFRHIPIIILTGAETKAEQRQRGYITGGELVVAKPIVANELIPIIREEVTKSRGSPVPPVTAETTHQGPEAPRVSY